MVLVRGLPMPEERGDAYYRLMVSAFGYNYPATSFEMRPLRMPGVRLSAGRRPLTCDNASYVVTRKFRLV